MKRLYHAVCSLIEAKAEQAHQPEPYDGEAVTQAERSGAYEPDELHAEQYRLAKAGSTGQRKLPNAVPPKIISRDQAPTPPHSVRLPTERVPGP